jgi:hypothetical protein
VHASCCTAQVPKQLAAACCTLLDSNCGFLSHKLVAVVSAALVTAAAMNPALKAARHRAGAERG